MSSYKQELIKGVFWSAIEKYSGLIVSIIVSMVLARILSPKEFGVVAIATVIIHFLQMFCTMGIGPAIIQKDLTQKELNSIFTFSLSIGIILALLFYNSSQLISTFYENEQLTIICKILSIQLIFASMNIVPNALMAKNKRFKEIAKRTLLLQTSSGILSVIAALHGAGVYALLISPIISSVGIFLWNIRYYKVQIDWRYDTKPIKSIFSFSSYQFLFEFVNYFSRNIDKLIIGRMISIEALGVYEKAYRLMQLPLQNVTSVINPVLQPVLRDLQNDKTILAEKYIKIIRFVATISFPIGIILSGMSTEIIHLFFGGRWDAAIPIFSILALSLPLQMILSTSGSIYLITNNTKMQFWIGIRNTVTTIAGFLIAALFFKTIEAMAWAWTITLVLNFIITYWLMYRYVLCQPISPLIKELIRPFIISIIAALTLFILNSITESNLLILNLIIKGCITLIVVLTTIQLLGQYDILDHIKRKYTKK